MCGRQPDKGLMVTNKKGAPQQDVESADEIVGAGNEIRTHDFNLGKSKVDSPELSKA